MCSIRRQENSSFTSSRSLLLIATLQLFLSSAYYLDQVPKAPRLIAAASDTALRHPLCPPTYTCHHQSRRPPVIMPGNRDQCSSCGAWKHGMAGYIAVSVPCPTESKCHTCTWRRDVLWKCCGNSACSRGYRTCLLCRGTGSVKNHVKCTKRTHIEYQSG